MQEAERHHRRNVNDEIAHVGDREAAMQPVKRKQQRDDHEMAGDLVDQHAAVADGVAAPHLVAYADIGARGDRDGEQNAPDRRQPPVDSLAHQRAFSQSINGVQAISRARLLTTIPI